MRPNTNARPDVQPALTLALDSEKSASLPPPVLLNVGIQGHPGRLACSCPRASSRPTHGASDCLLGGPACSVLNPRLSFPALSLGGATQRLLPTHPRASVRSALTRFPVLVQACILLLCVWQFQYLHAERERERERERQFQHLQLVQRRQIQPSAAAGIIKKPKGISQPLPTCTGNEGRGLQS